MADSSGLRHRRHVQSSESIELDALFDKIVDELNTRNVPLNMLFNSKDVVPVALHQHKLYFVYCDSVLGDVILRRGAEFGIFTMDPRTWKKMCCNDDGGDWWAVGHAPIDIMKEAYTHAVRRHLARRDNL